MDGQPNPDKRFVPLDFGYHDNDAALPARDPLDVPNRLPPDIVSYYDHLFSANEPALGRLAMTEGGNESPHGHLNPNS